MNRKNLLALLAGAFALMATVAQAAPPVWTLNSGSVLSNTTASVTPTSVTGGTCTAAGVAAIAVTGAALGDPCFSGPVGGTLQNVQVSCYVDSANSVTLEFCALTTATPTAGVYRVVVIH